MNPSWDACSVLEAVLARDLCLGVGTGPPQSAVPPQVGQLPVEVVGKLHSQGHALFSLVSGIAEHQTLVKIRILTKRGFTSNNCGLGSMNRAVEWLKGKKKLSKLEIVWQLYKFLKVSLQEPDLVK